MNVIKQPDFKPIDFDRFKYDNATIQQLIVLLNLESMNVELIKQGSV